MLDVGTVKTIENGVLAQCRRTNSRLKNVFVGFWHVSSIETTPSKVCKIANLWKCNSLVVRGCKRGICKVATKIRRVQSVHHFPLKIL
jgi:hypothetical protein